MDVCSVAGIRTLHAETAGDPRVCIALLDGPVDLSHPCFEGADLERLPTLAPGEPGTGPMSLHGTHIASILFGQPGGPVPGIAPRCRGLIVPVFRDDQHRLSQLDLTRAIEEAVDAGAHIINISGGERTPTGDPEGMLEQALRRCAERNVLVVAAAGNDGCDCLQVPAAVPSVLTVGACGPDGAPLALSNWGAAYRTSGVVAPGLDIVGAAPGGGTAGLTGSSFATPIVTGTVALLTGLRMRGSRAEPDPRGVGAAIVASATPCSPADAPDCPRYLAGRLNVPGAHHLVVTEGNTAVDSSDLTAAPAGTEAAAAAPDPATPPAVTAAGFGPPVPIAVPEPAAAIPPGPPPCTPAAVPAPAVAAAAAPAGQVPPAATPVGVRPSCGCGGAEQGQGLVYALGTIGFDYRTEARRDGFAQQMSDFEVRRTEPDDQNPYGVPVVQQPNPYNPNHVSAYLAQNPWASDKLTWTLTLDRTPIYALEAETPVGMTWDPFLPEDPAKELKDVVGYPDQLGDLLARFAAAPPVSYVYRVFRDAIVGQTAQPSDPNFVSRVSIPGVLTGRTVRLYSGQEVPVVQVKARGLHTWNEAALVTSVTERVEERLEASRANDELAPAANAPDRARTEQNVRAFLDKIYYQFRNLGRSPADRAMNYAGTNAFLFGNEIREGLLSGEYVPGANSGLFTLDTISVQKSPYCRMDSECWDVVITFFDPVDERRARVSWLFTIDVSDELPVNLAPAHRFIGRFQ